MNTELLIEPDEARLARRHPMKARLRVAGVDLGTHVAKVVIAEGSEFGRVIHAASRIVFPQGLSGRPIEQAAWVGRWVRQWSSISVGTVVCSLQSAYTEYEVIPAPSDGDARAAASAGIVSLLGSACDQAIYDSWQTMGEIDGIPCQVLHLIWTKDHLAREMCLELAKWGLSCRILKATPTVLYGVGATGEDVLSLIVDLGHDAATFALIDSADTVYVRNQVAVPTRAAVDQLADVMKCSRPAAETLLAEWGCDEEAGVIGQRISRILDVWLRGLQFELERTLAYLTQRLQGQAVQQITLCGGGSVMRGLDSWLGSRLDVAVRPAALSPGIRWIAAEPYSPLFAEATALALTGFPK